MKNLEKIPDFKFLIKFNPKKSLIAIVISSLMAFLITKCNVSTEDVLKFYNEIRKGIKFDLPDEKNIINELDNQLNDLINQDPELLKFKVRNEVNDAIARYERETGDYNRVQLPSPRYSERPLDTSVCSSEDCQSLGGEIRLCSPWSEGCPKTDGVLTEEPIGSIINESSGKPPEQFKFRF